ncbi:MAG: T9SS type A sorting domain-containing protein [Bacteroidales bacterium]|jgi:hypothetical protein|nr:T9SS type A sorting domain-containing protein [Bacteroidales bacterium]
MKKVSLIIALLFQCMLPAFAQQGHTLFNVNEHERVNAFDKFSQMTHNTPSIFHDYDEPDNLLVFSDGLIPKLYRMDNSINFIDSISFVDYWDKAGFKLNNKIYGMRWISGDYYIDSIIFYKYDMDGTNLITQKIYEYNIEAGDTVRFKPYNFCKFFVTKEKNIVVSMSKMGQPAPNIFNKIIVVDTLGNVLNSKLYNLYGIDSIGSYGYSNNLYEAGNRLELDISYSLWMVGEQQVTKAYYLDKQTLDIIDSAYYDLEIHFENRTTINDSIAIAITGCGTELFGENPEPDTLNLSIAVFDYKSHKRLDIIEIPITAEERDGAIFFLSDQDRLPFQRTIDFINEDSIYWCYFVRFGSGFDGNFAGRIYINNFGIDGTFNYKYCIEYDAPAGYAVNGVKATADGGLLMALMIDSIYLMETGFQFFSRGFILKFDPYGGFVNITNIDSEQPMVITYPNPASDNINFSCSEVIKEIEVFNLLGQQVYAAKVNDKFMTIDVGNFAKGNYVVKVYTDKGVMTKKFVVE